MAREQRRVDRRRAQQIALAPLAGVLYAALGAGSVQDQRGELRAQRDPAGQARVPSAAVRFDRAPRPSPTPWPACEFWERIACCARSRARQLLAALSAGRRPRCWCWLTQAPRACPVRVRVPARRDRRRRRTARSHAGADPTGETIAGPPSCSAPTRHCAAWSTSCSPPSPRSPRRIGAGGPSRSTATATSSGAVTFSAFRFFRRTRNACAGESSPASMCAGKAPAAWSLLVGGLLAAAIGIRPVYYLRRRPHSLLAAAIQLDGVRGKKRPTSNARPWPSPRAPVPHRRAGSLLGAVAVVAIAVPDEQPSTRRRR
ncbi:hypothetical protein HBB16_10020 [Pseudonocardia sp. MCCB 268]|nr:hypothetical protein [Pseudonocardia cytotoxica]